MSGKKHVWGTQKVSGPQTAAASKSGTGSETHGGNERRVKGRHKMRQTAHRQMWRVTEKEEGGDSYRSRNHPIYAIY